jgi:integrase/recombinase XerD
MNPKIRQEGQEEVELKLVQSHPISCPRCRGANYSKRCPTKAGTQQYYCKDCKIKFIQFSDKNLLRSDDVWFAEDLGLNIHPHRQNHGSKFNFQKIRQEWLKEVVKQFIKYKASIQLGFDMLQTYLRDLNHFSSFLVLNNSVNRIEDIDRFVIIKYLSYSSQDKLTPKTQGSRLSTLASLFETGTANNWFVLKPYLIRKEDYPKRIKGLPRYIPDDVIRQLNQHLDSLPESVTRMVLVIQECGLRIGELCQLSLDCLKQDAKGGWFIQFMRWKMKFETTLPISIELAEVIKEQQLYIQQNLGKDYQYLFCANKSGGFSHEFAPNPKVMGCKPFINYVKRLADEFDICDSTGKRWNFQTHQFRHTVGTRMINNGVPQHIVQRYLGHDTPHMTSVYAHIHDATLRKQIDKYLDTKVVNINGEVIESIASELDTDSKLQWMKKKVLAETLPNGYCGLPAQLTCSKGNACLTCSDFRTTVEFIDQHKQQLERTNQVLEVVQANGWERQIQVNQDVKTSLEKIITTLEANQDA